MLGLLSQDPLLQHSQRVKATDWSFLSTDTCQRTPTASTFCPWMLTARSSSSGWLMASSYGESSTSASSSRFSGCTPHRVYVPLVEFTCLAFALMPGKSYCRQLRSLLFCLCDAFQALINSLVCWVVSRMCDCVWGWRSEIFFFGGVGGWVCPPFFTSSPPPLSIPIPLLHTTTSPFPLTPPPQPPIPPPITCNILAKLLLSVRLLSVQLHFLFCLGVDWLRQGLLNNISFVGKWVLCRFRTGACQTTVH